MSIDIRRWLHVTLVCFAVALVPAAETAAQSVAVQVAPEALTSTYPQTPPAAQTPQPTPRPDVKAPELLRRLTQGRSTQPFQVILLVADMQGAGGTEGLPKSALRALDDLKDFLPFKSYRALDMAWIRTTGSAETRLTGPNGQPYYVRLHAQLGDSGARGEKIYVSSFELRDGDVHMLTPRPAATTTAERESERARENAAEMARDRAVDMLKRGGSRIISTSFGMEIGETVVVGTSKITGGDKALVVLLTAVPPTVSR